MPNQPAHATHTVRVPEDLWRTALEVTAAAGESVTAVVNRALVAYVAAPPGNGAEIAAGRLPCTVCGRVVSRAGGNGSAATRHKNTDSVWCAGSGV